MARVSPVTKGLVVRQPWATLIALAVKMWETRDYPPAGEMRPPGVRGLPGFGLERGERVAIVAGAAHGMPDYSKIGPYVYQRIVATERTPAHGALYTPQAYDIDCPLGAVVCTVEVADALPVFGPADDIPHHAALWINEYGRLRWLDTARTIGDWLDGRHVRGDQSDQLPLGDFTPGRWGWMLTDPHPCQPVACTGQRGLFRLPDLVTTALEP